MADDENNEEEEDEAETDVFIGSDEMVPSPLSSVGVGAEYAVLADDNDENDKALSEDDAIDDNDHEWDRD